MCVYAAEVGAVRRCKCEGHCLASMFTAEIGFVELRPQIAGFFNRAAIILIICVLAWKSTCHAHSLELTRKEFPGH